MSDTPRLPTDPAEITFVIDRLVWTDAVRYFLPTSTTGPPYLRTDVTAARAPRTHEQCLLELMASGCITTDTPDTECRLPVPERGRVAMVPLNLTPCGRRYLRRLLDAQPRKGSTK
ncbi:hypothetical protein [Kutzneria chonburiensis]|uniref:MarR family transcriptional regulator n=1 Tax=Kutzneria chonburiensis TaxID=1483604 RepID=A0ABV6MHT2_9PSEU|nr:hypothetical protein [Kutzneria chonburiensis]